jgi:hypothetical protein
MPSKSPQKETAKKPGRSIKEKRAAKKAKAGEKGTVGHS